MILKVGDRVEKIMGFAGPDEAEVTAGNIDELEGYVQGGLMKIVGDFRVPENKPENKDENTVVLPVTDVPRTRGRKRNTDPE